MPVATQVVIIGAGGFAREVLDVFDACNKDNQDYQVLGYIVESRYGIPGTLVNGKPILGDFDWFAQHPGDIFAICGVGAPAIRYRLIKRAMEYDVRFCNAIHPTAVLTPWITMGKGIVITAGCILTNQIQVGSHVHINLGCTIGHDAILEDFVTMAPGVHVSGKVRLSMGCYIGTGANIIEQVSIGEWAIVGAGSTVVKDIPANCTAVGIPGKVIKVRESGWHLLDGE
jgi:sugar O-acyltransferase (sialic acid O-acetyltransferase NeuD family)